MLDSSCCYLINWNTCSFMSCSMHLNRLNMNICSVMKISIVWLKAVFIVVVKCIPHLFLWIKSKAFFKFFTEEGAWNRTHTVGWRLIGAGLERVEFIVALLASIAFKDIQPCEEDWTSGCWAEDYQKICMPQISCLMLGKSYSLLLSCLYGVWYFPITSTN